MSVSVGMVARLGLAASGLALASAAFGLQASPSASPAAAVQPPPGVAAPQKAATAMSPEKLKMGRELFNNWGCNSCHVLNDADASGHVGPSLDGNPNLSHDLVVDRVSNGQGPMPAFGGQLTAEEIADLSSYVVAVAKN